MVSLILTRYSMCLKGKVLGTLINIHVTQSWIFFKLNRIGYMFIIKICMQQNLYKFSFSILWNQGGRVVINLLLPLTIRVSSFTKGTWELWVTALSWVHSQQLCLSKDQHLILTGNYVWSDSMGLARLHICLVRFTLLQ